MTEQKKQNATKAFYITTTLPYVNAEPHIGHAMEFIRADIIARYKKLMGFDVFFNTGTDEHGLKVFKKSEEEGVDIKNYVDKYAQKFKDLLKLLNISKDIHFVRTTDAHHKSAAQHFWELCDKSGDIYKKNYKIKYCVSCELEKTESELVNGRCAIHPHASLEIIEEENYFFKFSKYQSKLLDFYKNNPGFVVPNFRFNEIKKFVERGLDDFSVSRLKSKMPWGVPVPKDPDHVMYVWFDALVNYVSTLGWPESTANYEKYWVNGTPTQYAGKDNLRQQSAMWQAMLVSAGLSNSHNIVINGFINMGGEKMSKSLGNVVSPEKLVEEYGPDALRYFLVKEISNFEDSDFTLERFKEAYNANLANGLGNLVSRIMKMAEANLEDFKPVFDESISKNDFYKNSFESFKIQEAVEHIWASIKSLDQEIQHKEPFKLVKTNKEEGVEVIKSMVAKLFSIAEMLEPVLPETSEKIKFLIKENKSPNIPLFPRKD